MGLPHDLDRNSADLDGTTVHFKSFDHTAQYVAFSEARESAYLTTTDESVDAIKALVCAHRSTQDAETLLGMAS